METKNCNVRIRTPLREQVEAYQAENGFRDFSKALNAILEKFFADCKEN